MVAALKDIETKGLSIRNAAEEHGVSYSTLRRHLLSLTKQNLKEHHASMQKLTPEQEHQLVEYANQRFDDCCPMTKQEILNSAVYLCGTSVGKNWWSRFKKRFPELTLRMAEPYDRMKLRNTTPQVVSTLFEKLRKRLTLAAVLS